MTHLDQTAEKDGWTTLFESGLGFTNPPAPPQKPPLTLIEGRGKERQPCAKS